MAHEEDDDLYDEEFDFVDDDDEDQEDEEASSDESDDTDIADDEPAEEPANERKPAPRERTPARGERAERPERAESTDERAERAEGAEGEDEEPVDEYGRPETPPANYVVHVYEQKKFTRTIDRPFTPEDAEAFATEFNRTSKNYGRIAITGKNDAKPKKALD
jgi:hypothetical protein